MYIGLSKNIEQRIKEHFSHGINGKRKDDLDKPLYRAFKKASFASKCKKSFYKKRNTV